MHESEIKFRGKTLKLQIGGSGRWVMAAAWIILIVPYILTFTVIASIIIDLVLKYKGRKGLFRKGPNEFVIALNRTAWEKN